ncbi:MAG: ABC transporter ATP-binding protein [Lachnospiraceae bacterium]|nr:ABC transporter ATP-binding protein [Lachnospiraceae bacterium]MBQ2466789.1 ABC transporter ATP-binding protein [Lachnospiraceae bacterium]MBQ2504218.1 ABC transporter ATP-binding protein [Lachnospiraceae bacterium]MBQ2532288.1 ABC transporter ATP-binding protein [Lachnospiraceae bacterium]MBR0430562.1 ABC transporter ATP-binding protein [Lachnospiraceae bacterium]
MKLIKRLIPYYKPYIGVFILDLIAASIMSAIDLVFPQLLRFLRGTLFLQAPEVILSKLGLLAALLIVMYIIRSACKYYMSYQGHMMGARMESTMRRQLFDRFESLSFSYYDTHNTGEMMSKLVSDLFDISELAHHGPENIFISVVSIIGSLIFLLMINVPMTLCLVAVVILMAVFSILQNGKMRATFADNRKKIAGINSSLQDTLGGIRVVKSFTGEEIEQQKFDKSNLAFLDSKKANYIQMALFFSGTRMFQGLMYVTVLIAGGFFIAKGQLSGEELAIYALYINIFINPVNVLVEFTEQLQKGLAGFERFIDVIDTVPEIEDAPDAGELTDVKGVIDYKDVCFSYEEEEAVLEHIDFHVDAGKSIAIVGPSGGGKTTLCALLPRFYDVTGGSVCIDGVDIRTVTQKSLRSYIGIVQQDVYLFNGTIRENIAYGKPEATDAEIYEAAKNADLLDFINGLPNGFDTEVGERGTRLSGGQKQRIAIARVFLKNPPILILDEATSALDNESERFIQESLDRLSVGRTTITIAHRLSTILGADEIIVLDSDGIRERGTHKELMKLDGIYAKYYQMQFDVA